MGDILVRGTIKLTRSGSATADHSTTMPDFNQTDSLETIPLFCGLPASKIEWLRARLYARAFPANKEIMAAGMPGEQVYIILSGTVKVYVPQPDGEDVIVAILGPGDPVGEMSVIEQTGRSASVVTVEATRVLWMSQANFKEALDTIPALSQNLARILSGRLRSSTAHIQSLAALDVTGRVIRQLLAFADRYGQPGPDGAILIPIRLTQGDLAGLVGATRRRVNQSMVILKHSRLISIDSVYHITLLDPKALDAGAY